jgi:hypothetical protein
MVGLDQVILLFLLILVGFVVKKLNLITDDFQQGVSGYVINVALPAYIVTSLGANVSASMFKEAGLFFVISCLITTLTITFSYGFVKVFKIEGQARDIFQFILIFANVAFMGFPVIGAAFGEQGIFYTVVYNLLFNMLLWTFGVFLMKRHQDHETLRLSIWQKMKRMMNPALIAMAVGFSMAGLRVEFPTLVKDTLGMVGSTTSPLSMMFIGFILTEVHIKELIQDHRLYMIAVIRLIGFPLLFFMILSPFISGPMLGVSILLLGMPAGINTAMLAARYENDYKLASKMVFISTLASIVTIPLLIKFLIN